MQFDLIVLLAFVLIAIFLAGVIWFNIKLHDFRRTLVGLRSGYANLLRDYERLFTNYTHLKSVEAQRAVRRSEQARIGGLARAKAMKAKAQAEGPERRARTVEAAMSPAFRPRDEVVAHVAARRSARQNQSAGVAAKS